MFRECSVKRSAKVAFSVQPRFSRCQGPSMIFFLSKIFQDNTRRNTINCGTPSLFVFETHKTSKIMTSLGVQTAVTLKCLPKTSYMSLQF